MRRKFMQTICPNGDCENSIELEVIDAGENKQGFIPDHPRRDGHSCVLIGLDYFSVLQVDENR